VQALAQARTESFTDVSALEDSPLLPNGISALFNHNVKEEHTDDLRIVS
jgi:ribonuclease HI